MPRICVGIVATCRVVAGAIFACQLGLAATPLSGRPARGGADGTQPVAAPGTPVAKPPEEPLTVLKSGPDHIRVALRLKNSPATDVNAALLRLFRLEGGFQRSVAASAKAPAGSSVAIVTEPITNSLIISGPPEAVDEVRTLVQKLDSRPPMVLIEMEMGVVTLGKATASESPQPKEKSPATTAEPFQLPQRPAKMETTGRGRVVTLDNQPAFIQMGSRVPRVSSIKETGSEVRLDNVGLIVGVTPRIGDGVITMQIDVEDAQLAPESEGIPISVAGSKVVRSPVIKATVVQTTVRILDGQPLVLGSIAGQGKADKELVIIITPHIIAPQDAKKTQ